MTTLYHALQDLLLTKLSLEKFTSDLERNVAKFYRGDIDEFQLFDALLGILNRGFERAWQEGAAECGIQPGDRTPDEEARRINEINRHIPYMQKLAQDIIQSRQNYQAAIDAGEEPYRSDSMAHYVDVRASLWANRYNEVRNIAKMMACADEKLEWVLGPTEHCADCQRLAGKVKRASFWAMHYEIKPQSPLLACGGFNCQCRFERTDKPTSRGPLPFLTGPS